MCRLIHGNAAAGLSLFLSQLICSAQDCYHSGHQNLGTEGLGNILVHSQLKSLQFVSLISAGCQHDDRYFGVHPDLPAHLPSVHLRHHHIQNDQCDIFFFIKNIQCLLTITGFQYIKIALHQEIPDQLAHSALIIYYQYFQSVHTPSPSYLEIVTIQPHSQNRLFEAFLNTYTITCKYVNFVKLRSLYVILFPFPVPSAPSGSVPAPRWHICSADFFHNSGHWADRNSA